MRVPNDAGDFYRHLDAGPHAEFLYEGMQRNIEMRLPDEAGVLRRCNALRKDLGALFDMPELTIDLLFKFLHQNRGRLSRKGAPARVRAAD